MNKIFLAITLTIIATFFVLIANPSAQRNIHFASGNIGFKNIQTVNHTKQINNTQTKIEQEEQINDYSNKSDTPQQYKRTKIQAEQDSNTKKIKAEKTTVEIIKYIDWTEWRKSVLQKTHGRLLSGPKNFAWGIGAIIDKNSNLIEAYCYYIPKTSLIIEGSEWWLEANKPFYVYVGSNFNIYEAYYPKTIKPTPANLEEIAIKNITFSKKVYGFDIAKQAYDDYYEVVVNNDQYSCPTCTEEQLAFGGACSGGLMRIINGEHKSYPNKHTETQREWACRAMNMHAEASGWIKEDIMRNPSLYKFPEDTRRNSVFIGDIYLTKTNMNPIYNTYVFEDKEKIVQQKELTSSYE